MADMINFVDRALAPKPDVIVNAMDLPKRTETLGDPLAASGRLFAACLCASSSARMLAPRRRPVSPSTTLSLRRTGCASLRSLPPKETGNQASRNAQNGDFPMLRSRCARHEFRAKAAPRSEQANP